MDVTREHFLADAAFAGDHDRGIGACDTLRQRGQIAAALIDTHHVILRDIFGANMPRHRIEQRGSVEGLDQIIDGASLHRFDRFLDGAVGGHQQHGHFRAVRADVREQRVAIHRRHLHIADHHGEAVARCGIGQHGGGFDTVGGGRHGIAGEFQRVAQGFAQRGFVLDQQQHRFVAHPAFLRSSPSAATDTAVVTGSGCTEAGAGETGRRMPTVVPRPASESIHSSP